LGFAFGTVVATPLAALSELGAKTISSGVEELDRVLGGGFIPGSTTLLFGEPGVGKSTLALMALRQLAESGQPVLLIAAEESRARSRRARDVSGRCPANYWSVRPRRWKTPKV
jgi:DNA repair protein RadA/Sms